MDLQHMILRAPRSEVCRTFLESELSHLKTIREGKGRLWEGTRKRNLFLHPDYRAVHYHVTLISELLACAPGGRVQVRLVADDLKGQDPRFFDPALLERVCGQIKGLGIEKPALVS